MFLQPDELVSLLKEEATTKVVRRETSVMPGAEAFEAATTDDIWQERVWHALKNLDDRSVLNQSPLARLAYIQRLADREFRGNILIRGLALREALVRCIDKIIGEGKEEPGLHKTCQFLQLVKRGENLTAIAEVMELSREQVTRYHKRKAVELVTDEFSKMVKTRKRR